MPLSEVELDFLGFYESSPETRISNCLYTLDLPSESVHLIATVQGSLWMEWGRQDDHDHQSVGFGTFDPEDFVTLVQILKRAN